MRKGTRVEIVIDEREYWNTIGCEWLFRLPLEIKGRDRDPFCFDRYWVGPIGVNAQVSLHESLVREAK